MTTLTYTGELVVTSCWCGIYLAVPRDLYNEAQRDHKKGIHCPLGHTFVFTGDTEAQRLKRELQWERDRLAAVRAERDQAQASLSATKGVVTKMRKRAIAGACQFCHRHFGDLQRHVASKHPDETP